MCVFCELIIDGAEAAGGVGTVTEFVWKLADDAETRSYPVGLVVGVGPLIRLLGPEAASAADDVCVRAAASGSLW